MAVHWEMNPERPSRSALEIAASNESKFQEDLVIGGNLSGEDSQELEE